MRSPQARADIIAKSAAGKIKQRTLHLREGHTLPNHQHFNLHKFNLGTGC